MSRTLPDGVNVAQLTPAGVLWHPKEVVALVHALCDQNVGVATAEELWITNEGEVIAPDAGGTPAAPLLPSIGFLIDTVLPRFSEERAYTPAASLQMIPARLRGTAGPPILSTTELLSAIRHYETDIPARVLQQLVARMTAAAPDGVGREAVSAHEVEGESTALLIVSFEATDESLDEYPSERTASRCGASPPFDGLVSGNGIADPPEAAATAALQTPTLTRLAALCVGIASRLLLRVGKYRRVRPVGRAEGRLPGRDDPHRWPESFLAGLSTS